MKDPLLARDIRDLAKEPELAARGADLNSLAEALADPKETGVYGDRKQAEAWSEVDLFAAFPPETTVVATTAFPGWERISKLVYYLQAVLAFLPIAITWLGLKQATTAYGETLAQGDTEAARRPFLELWQLGFGGRLAEPWKFDNVAMMTLGSIGVLITVSLLERHAHRRMTAHAERRARVLRSRLLSVLTRASLHLGQVRLSAPARFQAELSKSANELSQLSETVRRMQFEVVRALEKTLEVSRETAEALSTGATDVRGSLNDMERQVKALTEAGESLTQAVERTGYAIDAVGEKTDEAVGRVGERLDKVLVDTTAELARATSEVQTAVDRVRAHLERVVTDTTQDVRAALSEVTAATGDAVRETTRHLDARVTALADTTAGIKTAVDAVGDVVHRIGAQMDDQLQAQSGLLAAVVEQSGGEVRAALGEWADRAGAHARRLEVVSDTAGRTIHLLEGTREVLERLPQELSKTLQEVPAAVHQGIGDDLTRLGAAVGRLNASIDELQAVLRAEARAARPEEPALDGTTITNGAV